MPPEDKDIDEQSSQNNREEERDTAVWKKYHESNFGVSVIVHTFPRVQLIDPDNQVLLSKIVFQDVYSNEELFAIDCNAYALKLIAESVLLSLLTGLKGMDSVRSGILSSPGAKAEWLEDLTTLTVSIDECRNLLSRLLRDEEDGLD